MPAIIRDYLDSAGGTIGTPLQIFCLEDGNPIAILGERVESHGEYPHTENQMIQASSYVKINNIGICRVGDQAKCGHYAAGGSLFVNSD